MLRGYVMIYYLLIIIYIKSEYYASKRLRTLVIMVELCLLRLEQSKF